MSQALILALISVLPAILEFIEFLIKNKKEPTADERAHMEDSLRQLDRAYPYMTKRQQARVGPRLARIRAFLNKEES